MPLSMVHGRHDISGPAITAWRIQQELPASTLTIVEDAGHGGPRIYKPLSEAVAAML